MHTSEKGCKNVNDDGGHFEDAVLKKKSVDK
jgi:hypothetical protein